MDKRSNALSKFLRERFEEPRTIDRDFKLTVLDFYEEALGYYLRHGIPGNTLSGLTVVVIEMAKKYKDHPDYKEDWFV